MLVLVKGKLKNFNPIMIDCINAGKKFTGRTRKNKQCDGKQAEALRYIEGITDDKKVAGNVWSYDIGFNMTTKDQIAFDHPAIFPESLANDHIISWSNENDLVFDPFMGSGTTEKMAKLNNRKFIGIEKVHEYFEIAKERIENA